MISRKEGKPRGRMWVENAKEERGIEMVIASEGDV